MCLNDKITFAHMEIGQRFTIGPDHRTIYKRVPHHHKERDPDPTNLGPYPVNAKDVRRPEYIYVELESEVSPVAESVQLRLV